MSKERLEEIKRAYGYGYKLDVNTYPHWLISRVEELQKDLEVLDSAIFRIGLTINNPDTSDDEKWEKVNGIISKTLEDKSE